MGSFREFLIIFRKAAAGELDLESGLGQLATLTEVDVDEVGVGGAKTFFEAKIAEVSKSSKFEEEIREEQEERKRGENPDNRLSERGQLSLVEALNCYVYRVKFL